MRVNLEGGIGEITSLPGNPQVVVTYAGFVPMSMRGNGVGSASHAARLLLMQQLGYDYALATVDMANTAQIRIMRKYEWDVLATFKSSKTGNTIALFGKQLS